MERKLQITQVTEINSSSVKVTFHQLAVTRLINQGILRLADNKAFFNDYEINLQDYILIDQHSITVLSPQAFEFLFSSTNTSSSSATQNSELLKKLQRNNEELKASNARQVATINQLQNLLNDFKNKNDDLRQRLRSAREQQEQLAISRQNLKEENLRLQKLVKRLQEERKKQATAEEKAEKTVDKKTAEKVIEKSMEKSIAKKSVSKPTTKKVVAKPKVKKPITKPKTKKPATKSIAKKVVAKPKTKKAVKKTTNKNYNDIKPTTLSAVDEKRFKELRAMSANKLAKTLALDKIPVKQRFDNSKDLRILALKATSQAELARWLHRGSSTIQDWTRATDNDEILKHFKK